MDRRPLLIIASCGPTAVSVVVVVQPAPAINNLWVVLCLLSVQQAFTRSTRRRAPQPLASTVLVPAFVRYRVADDDKV